MARKPSAEFERWAEGFNHRHRFGIPVTPITTNTRRVADMPPTIVPLPARSGSMQFTDEDVTAVIDLLRQCEVGQAVRLTDDADESDNTARRRAELLKEQIAKKIGDTPIKSGYKIRGHVLTAGDPSTVEKESKKTPGKKYKVTTYPQNWGALSLVPESTPDEPTPDPDPEPDPEPQTTGRGRGGRGRS